MKPRLVSLLIVAALAGCAKAPTPEAPKPKSILVRTAAIEYSTAASPVSVSGLLSRRTEADLAFKIGGIVAEVTVRAGDLVAQGQILARLRPDEIEAQVTQARSGVEKLRRDLVRVEKLQAGAVATLENLQDARTALELAEAQLRIAEFNRRHSVIAAPSAGRILRRNAEPYELVSAGRTILAFAADADGWVVRAGLAERDVTRVRVGDLAQLSFDSNPTPVTGRIIRISEGTDAGTRTTPIEIVVDAVPPGARSGFVVNVVLMPPPVAERPVVPVAALIEGVAGTAGVFVIPAGATRATRLIVKIEELRGEQAFLRTELPRTARIVVRGGEYLREGSAVTEAK